MAKKPKLTKPESELLDWFVARGYVRQLDPKRREDETSQKYKKGWEARFLVETIVEAYAVHALALAVGLRPGKVYMKHSRFVVPLYGRDAVEWFLERLPAGRRARAMGFADDGSRTERRPRT